jgi:hypothetical protein
MNAPFHAWGTIHPSVYREAGTLVRRAPASPRPHGALRYQCPLTGSLVLVTDDATLESLGRPLGRIRCSACGEMHMLSQDAD